MKADDVLTAVETRVKMVLHRLAEVEAAEGLQGSQTLGHARTVLRDAIHMIETYRAALQRDAAAERHGDEAAAYMQELALEDGTQRPEVARRGGPRHSAKRPPR